MIKTLRVRNLRSIADSGTLPIGSITLIVGSNNAGKSTLLRAISLMQDGHALNADDIRIGQRHAEVTMTLASGVKLARVDGKTIAVNDTETEVFSIILGSEGATRYLGTMPRPGRLGTQVNPFPSREPEHLIHPIFSRRSPSTFQQHTSTELARSVQSNDNNIVARVKRLAGSNVAEARRFRTLCKDILNVEFNVFDTANSGNQIVGIAVSLDRVIPVEAMGAGLLTTLNLLVSLSTARGKVFLVEEPENDLHPRALKSLLNAIMEASETNQFLITTHSGVVLTRLGSAANSSVLHVKSDDDLPPHASIKVADTASLRLEVLADLGYELSDMALKEGWLIFEESSAERFVRQHLARWFAPGILRLNLLAAGGDSRLTPIMQDYKEMLLFAHLEQVYRGRAWVFVDGGEQGRKIVNGLRSQFATWPTDHFQQWNELNFESYYPKKFADAVSAALAETDQKAKRAAKKRLLDEVLKWIDDNEDDAKAQFEISAAEIIAKLRAVEKKVLSLTYIQDVNSK
ncbi:AAA family ATPase [Catellatospora citrea]|uniref:ATP-dependent nuclease n=1 Tax=Catellatospora citrea TaxID=53366 RepID=UPI0034108E5F